MANSRRVAVIILINTLFPGLSNPHQLLVSQAVKGLNTSHYWQLCLFLALITEGDQLKMREKILHDFPYIHL